MKEKRKFGLSICASVLLLLLQLGFGYAFGSTCTDARLTAALLSLAQEPSIHDYTRLSYDDVDGSMSFRSALELIGKSYNSYKIFSHYAFLDGSHASSEGQAKVHCEEFDIDLDLLRVNGYNDLDYMYEIPLPLYKFYTDASGNVAPYPTSETRPMNIRWPGASYSSYVSSEFADKILADYGDVYKTYNDILEKGFIYNLALSKGNKTQEVTVSVNNIYLSSDTKNWDLETKDRFLGRYSNFPITFGSYHRYGIFVAEYKFFTDFGFRYEADIHTEYGNYDFYLKNIALPSIQAHHLRTVFHLNDGWTPYKDVSDLLLYGSNPNGFYLAGCILMGLGFFATYFLCFLYLSRSRYNFTRYKLLLVASPYMIIGLLHAVFSLAFMSRTYFYRLANNYVGNIILLIFIALIVCETIFTISKTRIPKEKNREKQ